MNAFKFSLLALLGSFLLSCATSGGPSELPPGVDLLFSGKAQSAHEVFASKCAQGQESYCHLEGSKWSSPKGLPILQGFSNTEWVLVNALPSDGSEVRYFYRPVGPFALKALSSQRVKGVSPSRLHVDRLKIAVQPGVTYELLALSNTGELLDRRRFSGLKLSVAGKKFALLSCLDDEYQKEQKVMWKRVQEEAPDVIFMIGDNTYATRMDGKHVPHVPPATLWSRYMDTISTLDVYRWESLVPIWAIWDDHDYGMNNGDATYPHRDQAQDIFRRIFPQHQELAGYESGPGVSYRVRLDDLDLYFFDNRSFRSPDAEAEHGHFGVQQEKWFESLIQGDRRAAWLISGDQFFGGYHRFESFQGSHPNSFEAFLKSLTRVRGPIAFLSGDRHLFELIKVPATHLGYPTFEVTSSALHARTYPNSFKDHPNPQMAAGVAGKLNFAVLDGVKVQGPKMSFRVSAYSEGPKPLVRRSLSVEKK